MLHKIRNRKLAQQIVAASSAILFLKLTLAKNFLSLLATNSRIISARDTRKNKMQTDITKY